MTGRIPQRFIDDLLDRLDIVDVVGARLELRKSGKNHSACCPFHDEKTPSFSVSPDKQFYYCFGCGAGGNAISFVMDYDRIDFPRAVETLAELIGMEVPSESTRDDKRADQRRLLYETLTKADQFYRHQLRQHPAASTAIDYLRGRGLSGETARDFGVGFAPPGWDNLLSTAENDDDQINLLATNGLLVIKEEDSSKIYDRFRHRIMFPIRDSRGRTVAFGGRVLGDDKPKYLNSPETPVFHKGRELYGLYEAARANKHMANVLVVEGYMDVLALAQYGITNAVATLGTATSTDHLHKLFRYTSEVVFCFDGDNAGRKAASHAMETALPLMTDGNSARFLFLPDGEDPDSLVRKIGTEAFEKLLSEATPLSAFLFDTLQDGLNLEIPDGQAKLSQLAAPFINKIPPGVFHQLMMNQLAEKTGLDNSTLASFIVEKTDTPPPEIDVPDGFPYDELPESRPQLGPRQAETKIKLPPAHLLIAILAHHPQLAILVEDKDLDQLATLDVPGTSILIPLIKLLKENPEYNLNHVLGYWRGMHGPEQAEQLGRIVNSDLVIAAGTFEVEVEESRKTQVKEILASLLLQADLELPAEQQIEQLTKQQPLSDQQHKIAVALWHKLNEENDRPELITAVKQLLTNKYAPEQ
jgi:DNA primase